MNTLDGAALQKAVPLFDRYDSNRAPIFSVFEGQFEGRVYANDAETVRWAVLRTPFLQHFIAGSPAKDCDAEIEDILFGTILGRETDKEITVLCVSEEWHDLLDRLFEKRKGVCDCRKIFAFNRENFSHVKRPVLTDGVRSAVGPRRCLPGSRIETWSARLYIGEQEVSHCDAIMIGRGMAELDVGTEEGFRNKGYATVAAAVLIEKLLEHGLTPSWSTWPYRVESQGLARKLGFDPMPDAKAWIWMESM